MSENMIDFDNLLLEQEDSSLSEPEAPALTVDTLNATLERIAAIEANLAMIVARIGNLTQQKRALERQLQHVRGPLRESLISYATEHGKGAKRKVTLEAGSIEYYNPSKNPYSVTVLNHELAVEKLGKAYPNAVSVKFDPKAVPWDTILQGALKAETIQDLESNLGISVRITAPKLFVRTIAKLTGYSEVPEELDTKGNDDDDDE